MIEMTGMEFLERGLCDGYSKKLGVSDNLLGDLLEIEGVLESDCNGGMLGACIVVQLSAVHDNEETWAKIWEMIQGEDDGDDQGL